MHIASGPAAGLRGGQQEMIAIERTARLRFESITWRFAQVTVICLTLIVTAIATAGYTEMYDKLSVTQEHQAKSYFKALMILSIIVLIHSTLALMYTIKYVMYTFKPQARKPPPVSALQFVPDTTYTADILHDLAQILFWLVYTVVIGVIFGIIKDHEGRNPEELKNRAAQTAVVLYALNMWLLLITAVWSLGLKGLVISVYETQANEIV